MHGGAVGTAAYLIVALPFIGDIQGTMLGHRLTATPLIITLVTLAGVAVIALWLWMARATSQGKNWARILSTALFGLATLQLLGEPWFRAGILRRADLADRPPRGVAALAPGLQRVLQVGQSGAVAAAVANFRPLTARGPSSGRHLPRSRWSL